MRRRRFTLALFGLALLASLTIGTLPVSGEGFLDLYAGAAFTRDADTTVTGIPFFLGEIQFDTGFVGGTRIGYWFEGAPWLGLALDGSWFRLDTDPSGGEVTVIPVSGLLMVRLPLGKNRDFPKGQVQPYFGIGPSAFISELAAKLTPLGVPVRFSDTAVHAGLDARAGLAVLPHKNVGLFVEYRYTSFEPKWREHGSTVDIDMNTHHVVGGISFRFP